MNLKARLAALVSLLGWSLSGEAFAHTAGESFFELHPEAGGARRYAEAFKVKGFLSKETHTHTMRLAPPLVITKAQLDAALDALAALLA